MSADTTTIFDQLAEDREVTLNDGRVLRLREEPDFDTSINDFDCYGRVEPCVADRDTGQVRRPHGFDGAAMKIWDAWGNAWWWQPTLEVWGTPRAEWHADRDRQHKEKSFMQDLLSFGFHVWVLEVCEGRDHYGQLIVRDHQAIGGVEPFVTDDDLAHIAAEMAAELGIDDEPLYGEA